ncbi:hypothetical protein PRZ48_003541 [Zasmidium cellare]|uniref:Uncharacterized protein n=1 Tax=Zasmidium cellare TaxID=395010 RepID=A0ABR0EWM8_ZASCE|nr:hypothetical protein PRZ48_003541 [Zasmidium cellare]
MDIKNSRRILLLGTREAGALDIVKDLTGSAPSPDINGSTAGLTHEWDVQTQYYTAKVPIWVDEVPDIESWKAEFLKAEAKEVVDAVGAWIFCFEPQKDGMIISEEVGNAMKGIQEVVERHGTFGSEVVFLAVAKAGVGKKEVAVGQGQEEQEDKCMEYGFEYICYGAEGKNEFGEKVGFERLKEALEANEWTAAGDEDDELDLDDLDFDIDDEDIGGFGREEAEMTAELFGMKAALNRDDDDDEFDPAAEDFVGSTLPEQAGQVEDLNRMMGKLMAVKEQSEGLPEAQRKRMAAKAVRDIMKENPDV